jgi:hypothetical protein
MKSNIMKRYQNMFKLLYDQSRNYSIAWNRLIEFIMLNNHPKFFFMVDHKFEWLFDNVKLVESLMDLYDEKLFKSDRYDYLGKLLLNHRNEFPKHFTQKLTEENRQIDEIAGKIKSSKKKTNILILQAGTGRSILRLSKLNPNTVFWVAERDIRLMRAAFANCMLHNIKAHLLCADHLRHAFDYSTENGKYNWQYANRWYEQKEKLKLMNENTEIHQRITTPTYYP